MKHHFPCPSHLEEHSCSECRQICDELSYLNLEERKEYLDRLRQSENDHCDKMQAWIDKGDVKILNKKHVFISGLDVNITLDRCPFCWRSL